MNEFTTIVAEDGWQAIYLNGQRLTQGPDLRAIELLNIIHGYQLGPDRIVTKIVAVDETWFSGQGGVFPEVITDVMFK